MRDWVTPTLLALRPGTISEESYRGELAHPIFCWRRLVDLFHHNFDADYMKDLVGSVLCDLPKDAFDKFSLSYPAFIVADRIAWIQRFNPMKEPTLIIFSHEILSMPWSAGRGTVCHEIAHAVRDDCSVPFSLDDPYRVTLERAADALCREWGFSEEISAARKNLSERRT